MELKETSVQQKVDEVRLVYLTKTPASQRTKVTNSEAAYHAFLSAWEEGTIEHHESFRILLLNRANRALGIAVVSSGGISGTVIDVRQIFQAAIKSNCSSIIAAHNHPSGNRQPSDADIQITNKLVEAGKLDSIDIDGVRFILVNDKAIKYKKQI